MPKKERPSLLMLIGFYVLGIIIGYGCRLLEIFRLGETFSWSLLFAPNSIPVALMYGGPMFGGMALVMFWMLCRALKENRKTSLS